MHRSSEFMKKTGGGLLLAAGLMLAGPVHAGDVTVREGETAKFQITVSPKSSIGRYQATIGGPSIRLWYDTDGGTAVEGTDYETAHSWKHNVRGVAGSPLTISVKTFEDDAVEGDETFNVRMRKVEVQVRQRWGASYWRVIPNSKWDFRGAKTATIEDATPSPQQHGSYEEEKYGPNYSGTVFGE